MSRSFLPASFEEWRSSSPGPKQQLVRSRQPANVDYVDDVAEVRALNRRSHDHQHDEKRSFPACLDDFGELVRVHGLWRESQSQLRSEQNHSNRQSQQFEEAMRDLEHKHQQQVSDVQRALQAAQGESEAKSLQINALKTENGILSERCRELSRAIERLQDRLSHEVQQKSELSQRVSELEIRMLEWQRQEPSHAVLLRAKDREIEELKMELALKNKRLHFAPDSRPRSSHEDREIPRFSSSSRLSSSFSASSPPSSRIDSTTRLSQSSRPPRRQNSLFHRADRTDYTSSLSQSTPRPRSSLYPSSSSSSSSLQSPSRSLHRSRSDPKYYGDDDGGYGHGHGGGDGGDGDGGGEDFKGWLARAEAEEERSRREGEEMQRYDEDEVSFDVSDGDGDGDGDDDGCILERPPPEAIHSLIRNLSHSTQPGPDGSDGSGHGGGTASALLLEIDAIYQKNFRRCLSAMKKQHFEQIKRMRRKIAHTMPYAHVRAQSEIQRLRRDIKDVRQALLDYQGNRSPALIQAALASVEAMARQVAVAQNLKDHSSSRTKNDGRRLEAWSR